MKKIFLIIFLFFVPFVAQAQGLVPCGGRDQDPCTFCDFFVLFDNIVRFFIGGIVPPVAVLMITIGGIMLFLSSDNPSNINKAKGIFKTVIIGLILIYGAWIIVNMFLTLPGLISADFGWNPAEWFTISCETQSACPGYCTGESYCGPGNHCISAYNCVSPNTCCCVPN